MRPFRKLLAFHCSKHSLIICGSSPRHALASLSTSDDSKKAIQLRILRGEAAQSNGLENLAPFSGAILAANLAGVPVNKINHLALAYLVSRVVYNFIYIVGIFLLFLHCSLLI